MTDRELARRLARRVDALWMSWVEAACCCDVGGVDPEPKVHSTDCYVRMHLKNRRSDERLIAKVLTD